MLEPTSAAPIYASFWRRLHAYGVDSLLVSILCILLDWQFGSSAHAQVSPDAAAQIQALIDAGLLPQGTDAQNLNSLVGSQLSEAFSWLDGALLLAVSAAYNILFTAGGWQATPGKRYFGIKVVTKDGAKLTYEHATYRHVMSGLSTLLAGLPYLTIFFTPERLAPHDMMCDTRVVMGKTTA